MYIKDNDKQLNSFLVPRWGGVFIYNQQDKEVNIVENDQAMKIFLTQLLDLIGLHLNKVKNIQYFLRIYSCKKKFLFLKNE